MSLLDKKWWYIGGAILLLLLMPALSVAQTPTPNPLWEIETQNAEAYNDQGVACARLGNYKQAIEDWEMFLKLAPDAPNRAQLEVWIDEAELVAGNSAFAFDLYQALKGENGNLFYSPYSISMALAMTYAGARGETEQQMADTLHFTLPQDRLHPAFRILDLELASRSEGAEGEDGEGFRLNIANSIWGQKGYSFLPEFLDVLAENYAVRLRLVDFENAPEESRGTINQWVSDQTEDRIKDLIPEGVIDRLTRLVLANAIYFSAAWRYPFEEELTHDGLFHLLDGGQVTVPMMEKMEIFGYTEGDGYQAVELPYHVGGVAQPWDRGEVSMVILLPAAGRFEEFEDWLDAERVGAIVNELTLDYFRFTMPKFKFDSSFQLADTLADMGMPSAFGPTVNFSGMDGTRDLFITDVVHEAFVSVDEAGTEAAAATAAMIAAGGPPPEVTVDRPFIFLIRDFKTGAILFVGRVVNPSI